MSGQITRKAPSFSPRVGVQTSGVGGVEDVEMRVLFDRLLATEGTWVVCSHPRVLCGIDSCVQLGWWKGEKSIRGHGNESYGVIHGGEPLLLRVYLDVDLLSIWAILG